MTTAQDLQSAINNVAKSLAELAAQIGQQFPTQPVPNGLAVEEATPAAKATAKKPPAKKAVTKPTAKKAPAKKAGAKKYGPVDASTPAAIREERQRLILKQLDADGGVVTKQDWVKIAERYGYSSRRLGGFFAKAGGVGMVEMTPDRKMVQLTAYGRSRLH